MSILARIVAIRDEQNHLSDSQKLAKHRRRKMFGTSPCENTDFGNHFRRNFSQRPKASLHLKLMQRPSPSFKFKRSVSDG